MRRFDGRVALVTGGARGIGRAVVTRLASEGAFVFIGDVDQPAATMLADELAPSGAVRALSLDVTDPASIDAAVSHLVEETRRLDVLVNNVGISVGTRFEDINARAWDEQTAPTLHGPVACTQACIPYLLESPVGGSVVMVGSVNGLTALGDIVYSAAKAGLQNVTQNLAILYSRRFLARQGTASKGVRFNMVAPGTVRTRVWTDTESGRASLEHLAQLYPMHRVGRPEDVAAAVAFLASDDAAWITGVTLPVDGGLTAGPLADWHDALSADQDRPPVQPLD